MSAEVPVKARQVGKVGTRFFCRKMIEHLWFDYPLREHMNLLKTPDATSIST